MYLWDETKDKPMGWKTVSFCCNESLAFGWCRAGDDEQPEELESGKTRAPGEEGEKKPAKGLKDKGAGMPSASALPASEWEPCRGIVT